MSPTDQLFRIRSAFDYAATEDLFLESVREMFDWQLTHSQIFRGICEQHHFTLSELRTVDDVLRIPHIIVTAFKERKLLSVPESEIIRTFTSSGTTGQQSQINWDRTSMERQSFMRDAIVESYGLVDQTQKVNYLIFSYEPAVSGTRGAAHTHSAYSKYAPAAEVYYAIRADAAGEPEFKIDGCIAALERFAASGLPLRVTGFPAFSYVTLRGLDQRGVRFQFPAESVLFSGGGWKNYTGQTITMDEYADLVHRVLGIHRSRIRDIYGMVEHGVPYLTCECGHFHVPIYSRVAAVSPRTMELLPDGEVGLLKLVTPYIRSTPALSVLSTDLGQTESHCPCGRPGRYIVLRGRGGVKKYAGCGISAAQLLNR